MKGCACGHGKARLVGAGILRFLVLVDAHNPAMTSSHPSTSVAPTLLGLHLPAHIRVFAAFFLYSFAFGGFFPRLAEIQRSMGVAEGALGFALIGAAVGTMVSLTFGSRVIERVGYRRTMLVLFPAISCCYALAAWSTGPVMLFCVLVPAGLAIGAVEQVVNIEADRVEHQMGKRIMNRAHAFWSFGLFSAGAVGALMSWAQISPQLHLMLMVPVVLSATVLALGRFTPAPHREGSRQEAPPLFAHPTWAIGVLVAVSLSAMLMEGAGIDWSAIYMRDVFDATATISGLAVATGALAQAGTRFVADRFVERHQPVRVARVLISIMGVGVLLVYAAPSAWVAFLGLALMGVGTSALFPLAMSAAAQRTDRPAAVNVAALAQTSFVAFLLGPPLLGWVAEHLGIRNAFGLGLPLVLLSLWTAGALASGSRAEAVAIRKD